MATRLAILALATGLLCLPAAANASHSYRWLEPGVVSTGDGDLYAEPGEEIRLRPRLHNDGWDAEPLTEISGSVEPYSNLYVEPGTLRWPDLAPRASAAATNELVITMPPPYDFECGRDLPLSVRLHTNRGYEWVDLTLPTGEPATPPSCRNNRNRPPVITAAATMVQWIYVDNLSWLNTWAEDPDGWIVSGRVSVDGRVQYEGPDYGSFHFQYATPGRRVFKVEVTDNDGATTSRTVLVDVRPKHGPPQMRPRPTLGPRFSLFAPRYLRTREANRHGISVTVNCKSTCAATAELQLTRYRARKLGLKAPRKRKFTIASETGPYRNWEHNFVLRPSARVRRALRRARTVPLLLKVTTYGLSYRNYGLRRSTQADIELRRR